MEHVEDGGAAMHVNARELVDLIAARDGEAGRLLEVLCGPEGGRVKVEIEAPASYVLALAYFAHASDAADSTGEGGDFLKKIADGKLRADSGKVQAAFVEALNHFMENSYFYIVHDLLAAAFEKANERPEALAEFKAQVEAARAKLRLPPEPCADPIEPYKDDIPF